MSLELMILAGGMGSRYGGLKQMDGVGPGGGRVLDYSIYDALRAGFGRIIFVTRREIGELFEREVVGRWRGKVACEVAFQELGDIPGNFSVPTGRRKPWGTAHAIWAGRGVVGGPFGVINADDFYGAGAFRALAIFLRSGGGMGRHAMVAYRLGNTLSAHGGVSRGVCVRGGDGALAGIQEYRQVARRGDGGVWGEGVDGGEILLGEGALVSMNCWGFQRSIFAELERGLVEFLGHVGGGGEEYTIPGVVDAMIRGGRGAVALLETGARWFGVTYREDRGEVAGRIRELTAGGEYPEDLWR